MSLQALSTARTGSLSPSGPGLLRGFPGGAVLGLTLVLGYGFFFAFFGINSREFYRNEGLRGAVAAETLRTGHWLVPTLHGEPFLTKPPGMTLAIGLVSLPWGEVHEWTARLPSAIAAALTVIFFLAYFTWQSGMRAGLVAAALVPASLLWLDRAPSAEIDMLQLAWVSAAILCFFVALEISEFTSEKRATGWWLGALLCVAGGFLTKWTAPAFFYLTVVPLLWWRGRLRLLLSMPHLLALAVAASLCLAWILAAASQVGARVLLDTVLREALQRLSPAHHARAYPWGEVLTFPLLFLAATLPWSAFALVTFHPWFTRLWDERGRRLLQGLHCWLWINLLFWALVPGHRPRHCLPLQPPVAALAALVWIAWLDGSWRWPLRWCRPAAVLLGLLAMFLAVKIVFVLSVSTPHHGHGLQLQGHRLAAHVPADSPLFIVRLKDDGLLFYFGRQTLRLAGPGLLAAKRKPAYCLLAAAEWQQWPRDQPVEEVARLHDGQGDPLVLVRVP